MQSEELGLGGIQKLTEIILPPIEARYSVGSLVVDNDGAIYKVTKKEPMDGAALIEIVNSLSYPLFICHLASKDDFGHYVYIDESGRVRKQLTDQRSCGRYFLRQFFEDAILNSFQGTGSLEVYALPHKYDKDGDLVNGWVTHYFSRANDIFRNLSGRSLNSIGLYNKRRRDSYEDENGNALPVYRYDLKCNLLLIQPEVIRT